MYGACIVFAKKKKMHTPVRTHATRHDTTRRTHLHHGRRQQRVVLLLEGRHNVRHLLVVVAVPRRHDHRVLLLPLPLCEKALVTAVLAGGRSVGGLFGGGVVAAERAVPTGA